YVQICIYPYAQKKDIKNVIDNCPKTIDEFKNNIKNKDIILPDDNKTVEKQYTLIKTDEEFYKYITDINLIREKLILTVLEYQYNAIMIANSKTPILSTDIIKIITNVYEGDINKILTIAH